jgi:hypothetical protein
VQISTTNPSRVYFDDDLSGARMRLRHILKFNITDSARNFSNSNHGRVPTPQSSVLIWTGANFNGL